MTEAKHACCVRVYGTGFTLRAFRGAPCSKKAKVERNGSWYCGIHDPERVAAKRAERDKEWAAQFKKNHEIRQLQSAASDMLACLKNMRDQVYYDIARGGGLFADGDLKEIDAAIAKAEGQS